MPDSSALACPCSRGVFWRCTFVLSLARGVHYPILREISWTGCSQVATVRPGIPRRGDLPRAAPRQGGTAHE